MKYTHEQENIIQERYNSLPECRRINLNKLDNDERLFYEHCLIIKESKPFKKALQNSIHRDRNNLSSLISAYQIVELSGYTGMLEEGLKRANLVLNPIKEKVKSKECLWDSYLYNGRLSYNTELKKR